MQVGPYRFDRMELAGSVGDLGVLIPMALGLIAVNGLSFTAVFLTIALYYLASGLYFRLPLPVQPLKLVAAIAIAYPAQVTPGVISATGILMGVVFVALSLPGGIDRLARLFTTPVVRGIQLGLGLILLTKGVDYIRTADLFLRDGSPSPELGPIPLNLLLGLVGVPVALLLLNSRLLPAALVVLVSGLVVGLAMDPLPISAWSEGALDLAIAQPSWADFVTALVLLVIPQIPLTVGNAVIGTADTARNLFGTGPATERASPRALSASIGMANVAAGLMSAMPMCHGAGGLAAHYRFGARTGGSNVLIGLILGTLAIGLGTAGMELLARLPNAVFGVLLIFAGLELALLIRDVRERNALFLVLLIAGLGVATGSMSVAFVAGIALERLMRWFRVEI